MRSSRNWVPAIVVLLVSLASGGWLLQHSEGYAAGMGIDAAMFETVQGYVHDRFVKEVDSPELYTMAIAGMLERLGDPYAAFIRPEDREQATLSNNYGGVGMRVLAEDDGITILDVIPGSPAARMDLRSEDRIIGVDGESTVGWTQETAISSLRGVKGDPVSLDVDRPGVVEVLRFTIIRDDVHVVAVRTALLDDGVGYVLLDQFSRSARIEMQEAIDGLLDRGATSVILDLRFNPGGILTEGVDVSDLFLDAGLEVVDTRARDSRDSETFYTSEPDAYPGLPVIILVNQRSASASEIVAGALQDHDRALVIGTPTFGKGIMQSVFPLHGGNYLRLTTGTWFTPSGRSIHRSRRSADDSDTYLLGSLEFNEAVLQSVQMAPSEDDIRRVDEDGQTSEFYYTASGRVVLGGGGITPDVIVEPDTMTMEEQELLVALRDAEVSFYDLALRFALTWTRSQPDLRSDFSMTPAMRDAFFTYLTEHGDGRLDRAVLEGAAGLLDYHLARQIAYAAFGESASLERGLTRSREVGAALEFLSQADSPAQLLTLAEMARDEKQARSSDQEAGTG